MAPCGAQLYGKSPRLSLGGSVSVMSKTKAFRAARRCLTFALAALFSFALPLDDAGAVDPRTRTIFETLDTNADSKLDRTEFRLNRLAVFMLQDDNGDGYLQFEETEVTPEEFAAADKDGDGRLSGLEFLDAPYTRFEAIDRNGDGLITFEEFVVYVEGSKR